MNRRGIIGYYLKLFSCGFGLNLFGLARCACGPDHSSDLLIGSRFDQLLNSHIHDVVIGISALIVKSDFAISIVELLRKEICINGEYMLYYVCDGGVEPYALR